MSKIGKQPIIIANGVQVEINEGKVKIAGPKGSLEKTLPRGITAKIEGESLIIERKGESKQMKSLHGTFRSILDSMVRGVNAGFTKQLELIGTGFRADVQGGSLNLIVGFSHPVMIKAPEGISFKVEKNVVTVEGIDKEIVGLVASQIRAVRPPEPYKGKGIKYIDEVIRRKPGKAAAKAAGV